MGRSRETLATQLWEAEKEGFSLAARKLVYLIASGSRIRVWRGLFEEIYPELSGRLQVVRGWWNPTLSLAAALHFYPQVYLVVQECGLAGLLRRLGLNPDTLRWVLEQGRAIALIASPHTSCDEELLGLIVEAQGSVPSVLRVTETLKVVLGRLHGSPIYNTASLHRAASKVYSDEEARDLATRISDLAAFGMEGLAETLLDEALSSRRGLVLARAFHHILVEPIVDSMATIASYSRADIELLEAAARSGSGLASTILDYIAVASSRAKLWIPRRADPAVLERILSSGDIAWAHEMLENMRRKLESLNKENPRDVLAEAASISREIVRVVESANRKVEMSHGLGGKTMLALGVLSQIPLSLLLPTDNIVEAGLSTLASLAAERLTIEAVRRISRKLLLRLEEIVVVPALPLLLAV